jgi:hypothetical protein
MNENPQDEGRDYPDILFEISPRFLPNEMKERTRSIRRMKLGLVLS